MTRPARSLAQRRDRRMLALTLAILTAGAAYYEYWQLYGHNWIATDDSFVTGNVITLSAQTEGAVIEIRTESTRPVEAGDVLVRLDGVRAEIALEEAKAQLGETVRRIAGVFSDVEKFRRQIQVKKAQLNRVQHDLKRYRGAYAEDAVPEQQLQNAEDQQHELEAAIRQSEAELQSAETQITGTTVRNHPAVRRASEQVRRGYLEFVRRNVLAPVRGYVAKRKVQIGEHVRPGAPLMAIVPLDLLWVEANFKETELANLRPGQPAQITVDMLGKGIEYHGIVEGLQPGTGSTFALLPPENASGNFIHIVERVPVRIGLAPDELAAHPLRPGLSTVTRIDVSRPGRSVLESLTTFDHPAYRTDIYQHELAGMDEMIRQIVESNLAALDPGQRERAKPH